MKTFDIIVFAEQGSGAVERDVALTELWYKLKYWRSKFQYELESNIWAQDLSLIKN